MVRLSQYIIIKRSLSGFFFRRDGDDEFSQTRKYVRMELLFKNEEESKSS